jgi:hypothetical protein
MATTLTISYDISNDPKRNIQGYLIKLFNTAKEATVKSNLSINSKTITVILTGKDEDIMNLLHSIRIDYEPENSSSTTPLTFVVNNTVGSVSEYLFKMFTDARSMALKSTFVSVGEDMKLTISGTIRDLHSLLNPSPNSPETNSSYRNSPNRNSRLPKSMKSTNGRSNNKRGIAFNRERVTVKQPLFGGSRRRHRKTRFRR